MKEALFYKDIGRGAVQCLLCPQLCRVTEGKTGFCGVRTNKDGKLYSLNYGRVASVALDPVEKKPLYHYHRGEFILSLGTIGCNLSCLFCQNWSISQQVETPTDPITSEEVIEKAKQLNSFGIAYTYNEPFIWYEFVAETARLARQHGLKNVLVTNGYCLPEPLSKLLPYIDAMNIDIKSVRDKFYRENCSGRVSYVLDTVKTCSRSCHVELTNLIIPTLNDSAEDLYDLVQWIHENVGDSVPLHFSRYFPCYKMTLPPTPVETLKKAESIAREKLKYVYLGNVW